jgi:hypothetical protein
VGGSGSRYRPGRLRWRLHGTRAAVLGASVSLLGLVALTSTPANVAATWPSDVFTVGTFNGVQGPDGCATIQCAVDDAEQYARDNPLSDGQAPSTYVLVAPGDYKTTSVEPSPAGAPPAGVLVTEPNLWLVGMNRNTVVVDGTRSGPECSTDPGDQNFGPDGSGLNGIVVWKAANVWVENLTACNFLAGTSSYGATGNEIWWNGGANSAQVFSGSYWGQDLTATSTYFDGESTAAQYGIFSSNWGGGVTSTNANTAVWDDTYASNFNDSGYYIGACQQVCDQTVDHAWSEYNALGYSGSNSGGRLLVEHSQFDNNEDGFDTNSQNGDNPPPQDGACPAGVRPPLPGVTTCWVFYDNYVHDNNNPDVPTAGSAAAGPVGTGMSLSGARNDTVYKNVFERNDAWGTILVPYPDSGPPCSGGTMTPDGTCLFDQYGDAVIDNTYADNGSYKNPTNGDIGAVNLEPNPPDCFAGNQDENGLTTSPPLAQILYPACIDVPVPPDANALFTDEVACDSDSISIGPLQGGTVCLPGSNYPRQTDVVMHPLPGVLQALGTPGATPGSPAWTQALEDPGLTSLPTPTQEDLCSRLFAGHMPANPWCPAG